MKQRALRDIAEGALFHLVLRKAVTGAAGLPLEYALSDFTGGEPGMSVLENATSPEYRCPIGAKSKSAPPERSGR